MSLTEQRNWTGARHSTRLNRCLAGSAVVIGLALLFALSMPAAGAQEAAPAPILLTNAQQIAAITTNDLAKARYTARFRGVIIYISSLVRRFYIQEGTNSIQVNLPGSATSYSIGQFVEATGRVSYASPKANLVNATVTVLGEAPLPESPFVSPWDLAQGAEALRLVTTRGIVRDMVAAPGILTLMVSEEGMWFEVAIQQDAPNLPREWLDAEIEVRGNSFPFFNARGRPTGFRFHTHTTNSVRVLKPGSGVLFNRPSRSIAEATAMPEQWLNRVKITGTVTAHQPFEFVYVDDGTGPMQVNLMTLLAKPAGGKTLEHEPRVWLKPGDRVEVIGTRHNWFSLTPTLIFADIRRIGTGPPVVPIPVSIRELMAGRRAGKLVSVVGRILDQRSWVTGVLHRQTLTLQSDDQIFQATWINETPADWEIEPNSYVRVTGVNDTMQGRFKGAPVFQILMRSPADIAPALPPPLWTRPQFWKPAAAAAFVGLLAAAWIFLQRWQMRRLERRVEDRTVDLSSANTRLKAEVLARERAENEVQRALAQEKELSELKNRFVSMVSHEFRTPLGIITSSAEILDAYLERLSAEERKSNIQDITDATRNMSGMMEEVLLLGRVEAGKTTCVPMPLDLGAFGRRLVDEIISVTNARCALHFTIAPGLGEVRGDEALLRHIFTNLLNNATKYSPAGSTVEFNIEARGRHAVFTVRDQGIGIPEDAAHRLFEAFHRGQNVGDTPGTGLGLTIVKRCVDLHGGEIAFKSREGFGTTFVVVLPLLVSPVGDGSTASQILRSVLSGRANCITS